MSKYDQYRQLNQMSKDDDESLIEFIVSFPELFPYFDADDLSDIKENGDAWNGTALSLARADLPGLLEEFERLKPILRPCWYCGIIYRQTMDEAEAENAKKYGVRIRHKDTNHFCGNCHQSRGFLSDGWEHRTIWIIQDGGKLRIDDKR